MKMHEDWWDYFDVDPYEVLGRQMTGLFGEPITIRLDRISWAYLDWLNSELKGDIKRFVRDVERALRPEHGDRDTAYAGAVHNVYLRYERDGKRRPPWCPPANPIFFNDLGDIDISE